QGAGCIVLAHDTGRVLLAHRSADVLEPGTWGNWGGAVDEGVSPKSHALKELYEETGYQGPVESTRPLLVFEKGAFRYSNYLVVVPTEFEPELNWEADGYRWCEINEWPQPLHYGLKALFSDSKSINVLRAEVLRESAFATEAKARLDALPEGFTDWVHELPELPEGIPEVIGEGANSNVMLDEDDSFHHEIHSAHGSYNFPWRADGQHGYATARYKGRGREMKIDILSIRTDEGEEIEDAGHLGKLVHEQAIAFIGQE
ncbi:MAG: NUDIX hydrolase, partial [Alphaproteobacteria bacterium]